MRRPKGSVSSAQVQPLVRVLEFCVSRLPSEAEIAMLSKASRRGAPFMDRKDAMDVSDEEDEGLGRGDSKAIPHFDPGPQVGSTTR
jgi:hypothetical protein